MAPRRLIFVLLVILMISSFAAALAPVPEDDEPAETTTERSEPAADTDVEAGSPDGDSERADSESAGSSEGGRSGEADGFREATIDAGARRPRTVRATVGEELALTVTSDRALDVEIPALGAFEPADADLPAVFELVASEPAIYPVREAPSGRLIARLEFRPAAR